MEITSHQLRAGRALIGLHISELAILAKVSPETVSAMESGTVTPRNNTVEAIWSVLEGKGVELIGNRGVALRDDSTRIIEGEDAYLVLLDDIFRVLHGQENPEAFFFFVDNSKSPPEAVASHKRLRDSGIKCRYLCQENPSRLDFSARDYRAVPERFFYNAVQISYGDYVAHRYSDTPQRFMVVKSLELAESMRRLFEMLWLSLPMPKEGTP